MYKENKNISIFILSGVNVFSKLILSTRPKLHTPNSTLQTKKLKKAIRTPEL